MKRVKALLLVDSMISSIYNLYQAVTERNKGELKKNSELQNIIGDTCFVIGNGPSLTKEVLDEIINCPTFTVNFFHKGYADYPSAYHCILDPSFGGEKYLPYLYSLMNRLKDTKFIINGEVLKDKSLPSENIYKVHPNYVNHRDFIRCDMTKIMTGSINVIPFTIQCAMYIGYKKIYLLGCDFNSYTTLKDEHFYDKKTKRGSRIGNDLLGSAFAHFQHYAINNYAEKNGIQIVNLTPNSLIDAYRRGNFEDVIKTIRTSGV